jgi:hypothetical protein
VLDTAVADVEVHDAIETVEHAISEVAFARFASQKSAGAMLAQVGLHIGWRHSIVRSLS